MKEKVNENRTEIATGELNVGEVMVTNNNYHIHGSIS